ncbi:LytTR family transcriptional regulator DNA-binding domain-containing protein [Emticicia sp. BO119]|uniref:LytTR family transcriptional regulator DNA-binding domain-containing protein n=1 Tax=Emticicia sp. BO119 TaxID=2757768 RepID=UPI0015F049CF|nr:LytTR family transcriptional regulator DNA-binding domain-containing protein [Emticicia sp. BO119]MBA4851864.1 LytTR family transcriptional regulator DNA-binding domain-containing protein [Emticicia sp. BO119]
MYSTVSRNTRIVRLEEEQKIIYIKHLGIQPYNEVKFECGKKIIVSYSLNYWQSVFQDFKRINKAVLINPQKVINSMTSFEVELIDNSRFTYSRRKYKSLS